MMFVHAHKNEKHMNNSQLVKIKLSLGDEFCFRQHTCRFIKVTKKGFNLVNLDTNRCLFPRHIYMLGMGGKEFKKGAISGNFMMPWYYSYYLTKKKD